MPDPSATKSSRSRSKKTAAAAEEERRFAAPESEEIQRIQALLRRMDQSLAGEGAVSLKELAQAVHTAGDGGKSIAQLRKFAQEMGTAATDEDYQKARTGLFAMLEKLGQWKEEDGTA